MSMTFARKNTILRYTFTGPTNNVLCRKKQESLCKRCKHSRIYKAETAQQKPTVHSPKTINTYLLCGGVDELRSEANQPRPFSGCSRRQLIIHSADILPAAVVAAPAKDNKARPRRGADSKLCGTGKEQGRRGC